MKKLLGTGAAVAAAAWAVRGRSSSAFGPNVWHGPRDMPDIAITFDDGPSESTCRLLDLLDAHSVPATFFQCGVNVDALPVVTREVHTRGHEIGNHSYSHPLMAGKRPRFNSDQILRTQWSIQNAAGHAPTLYRAPYGVRWFGLQNLLLTGVMWDVLGLDWKMDGAAVAQRILRRVRNGSILCLHDGRELNRAAPIPSTLQAVRWVLPRLIDRGFRFRTVSQLCQKMN